MATFHDLTTSQLKQAVQIREQIESLQAKLDGLLNGSTPATKAKPGPAKGTRTLSAATKKKMAAAQQARRAKAREKPAPVKAAAKPSARVKAPAKAAPKKKDFSPEHRAKLAAAMKARWVAKRKDEGTPAATAK